MIKNNKGISLITMGMTVLILVIILTTLAYTAISNFKVRKLNDLYTDLKTLSDEVAVYYLENKQLPVSSEYKVIEEGDTLGEDINFVTKGGVFSGQESLINPNDYDPSSEKGRAVYYELDIDVFDNITLANTGKYIINEQSHTVYYVNGVSVNGTVYHSLQLKYSDIEVNNRKPISSVNTKTVYLPMGEKTLNLRDYLEFVTADGSSAVPKSIKYTVTTASYDQYFYLKDGKITSTNNSIVMPTPFKIKVEVESYDSTQVVSADLTVYLTSVAVYDADNNQLNKVNLLKGNDTTVYVEGIANAGELCIKAKVDEGNGIDASIGSAAVNIGNKTLYPLVIKGTNTGKVTLTVYENNGNSSREISVNVYAMTINSDRLSERGLVFSSVNDKEDITLVINDLFDISLIENNVVWSSSNDSIITVKTDKSLKTTATATGYGTATIYCEVIIDNKTMERLSIPVTVIEPVAENQ